MICDTSLLSFLYLGEGMKVVEAKVVLLGSQGVGKTSLVTRYLDKRFDSLVSPTIGASFQALKITVSDIDIKLQIWDTAGQERFRAMAPLYYRKANAAIVVYDITSESSFEAVKHWVKELKQHVEEAILIYVVGNKSDLASHRAVPVEKAQQYALSIGAQFFECSALNNDGIHDIFYGLASNLAKQEEEKALANVAEPDQTSGGSSKQPRRSVGLTTNSVDLTRESSTEARGGLSTCVC